MIGSAKGQHGSSICFSQTSENFSPPSPPAASPAAFPSPAKPGTEAVISFDPLYRDENLSYWAEAGRLLGADPAFTLTEESGDSYYEMGGVTFAPNIVIHGEADKRTVMEAIEAEYPEFIDMLEEWFRERGKPVYA